MTEGISGTSYQLYQQPDPLRDEPEEHSWDTEIDGLRNRDMAEEALAMELTRASGHTTHFSKLAEDDQHWLLDELESSRSYPETVAKFLERRGNEEHVEELMADFEARLERGR